MQKLYGDGIRKEAGFTKTLKNAAISIPKKIPQKLQTEITRLINEKEVQAAVNTTKNVERIVKETVEKVEKAVEETKDAVGDLMVAGKTYTYSVNSNNAVVLIYPNNSPSSYPRSII